jgi:hypothetical protein
LFPQASFIAPDGTLWNAWSSELQQFTRGKWTRPVDSKWARSTNGEALRVGSDLRAINDVGPPWVLLDRDREALLSLSYLPGMSDVRLEAVALSDTRGEIKVRDAMNYTGKELLLATDRGLRTFALRANSIGSPGIDVGDHPVARICRDSFGRIWLGGNGLGVIDGERKVFHSLDAVPMIGQCSIAAIAIDPGRSGGVIVAVEDRGVVFLQASATSAVPESRARAGGNQK